MGVLEVFASISKVGWEQHDGEDDGASQYIAQEFITAPVVLQRTTASCIYGAVEASQPSFSIAALKDWAASSPDKIGIIADCPDNARANLRAKKAMADDLPANLLFDDIAGCAVHRFHNFITRVTWGVQVGWTRPCVPRGLQRRITPGSVARCCSPPRQHRASRAPRRA
jgi:hypothetical protein